jgi:hypothetical protein
MEAVMCLRQRKDVDVGGELVIQTAAKRLRRQRRVNVEMRDLHKRMNASIGPTRALAIEPALASDRCNRALQFSLDGPSVLLLLPPAVPRPGVLENYFESRHKGS